MIRSTRAVAGCGAEEVATFEIPQSEAAAIDSAHRLMIQYFEGHLPDENLGPIDPGPDASPEAALLKPYRPLDGGGAAPCEQSSDSTCWVPINQARMDG
jgi:hypothetical protein